MSFQIPLSVANETVLHNESIFLVILSFISSFSQLDWETVLTNVSPYSLSFLGIALGLFLSVIGASWYFDFVLPSNSYFFSLGVFGQLLLPWWVPQWSLLESVQRISSGISFLSSQLVIFLLSIIFCEANAIYGVIIAVVLATKVTLTINASGYPEDYNFNALWYSGYSIFAAGLIVGLSNICSGYAPPWLSPPNLVFPSVFVDPVVFWLMLRMVHCTPKYWLHRFSLLLWASMALS